MTFWENASVATHAETHVPCATVPHALWTSPGPSGWAKGQDMVDIRNFHFLRAYHCAGRCTDCGACERACPMGINVRDFTSKLNKDCFELYGWEAGLSLDARPALDTFNPDDPEDFIK